MNSKIKFITNGRHLPYNPDLVGRAKELRKNMTAAERKLWYEYLRYFKYPVLRQRPIDNFIVDFYCPKLKLIVEIDGETHIETHEVEYDKNRTRVLEGYGLKVIILNYETAHFTLSLRGSERAKRENGRSNPEINAYCFGIASSFRSASLHFIPRNDKEICLFRNSK